MYLNIGEATQVKHIQNEFNSVYPFLKIDFLKERAVNKKLLQKAEKVNPDDKILTTGIKINIGRQRTVAQLKNDLKQMLGLTAEVFRKSGNMLWIETSLTDDWTLEQQNNEGELISLHNIQ
ncbi:MAG TPA: hypothetical protein PLA68_02915 [Panacibacter sp.]|nr:hypothetical protein [Panacibacter sp.]